MAENVFDPYDTDDEHLFKRTCDDCEGELPNCYCNQVDLDHDIEKEAE